MSRCYARHREPPFERCEREGGHDGLHEVSHTWSDEETWEPSPHDLEAVRMVPVLDVPMRKDKPTVSPMDVPCFVCACTEAQHGVSGCEAHSCRTFVPS